MKADFMTTRDETPLVEPDATLTSTIRAALPLRDIRSDLAQSHRLQAESLRALARYEQASARHLFATQMELDGYIDHLNQQAATFDAKAADVDHQIATGAK